MMLAKVPRDRAEAARKRLFRRGLVRKDLRIFEEDGNVLLPLRAEPDPELQRELGISIVDGQAQERTFYRSPQELAAEAADIPEELKSLLPQRWEHIGDVIIIRVPEQLEPYAGEAAAAYAKVLKAKAVIREVGRIRGVYRTPEMEVLYGTDTETVHFENGMYYKLDAAKLMFSSGNIDEKLRMAALDCAGETVVDMFAGIGYFTLPLAVHTGASKVIACEINPLAFRYLQENVRLNRVEKVVQPFHGDNRELPGERIADRVIMGYVRTTGEHLEKAFDLVKPGGTIHYQDTFPLEVWPQMALDNVARASKGRRYEVMLMKEVKSYSPGVSHMVLDIKVLD